MVTPTIAYIKFPPKCLGILDTEGKNNNNDDSDASAPPQKK